MEHTTVSFMGGFSRSLIGLGIKKADAITIEQVRIYNTIDQQVYALDWTRDRLIFSILKANFLQNSLPTMATLINRC